MVRGTALTQQYKNLEPLLELAKWLFSLCLLNP